MKIIKNFDTNEGFPYIAYIPDNIGENPALIIQLHGAGERGNTKEDLDKVLVHGFSHVVTDNNLKNTILIMPQCPKDSFWAARVESIVSFVEKAITYYKADKKRVYLTGLSMGGFGTWYTAMARPDLFAAIVPICGGGMPWNAGVLNMPIWVFHGAEDTVVLPSNSADMVDKLRALGKDITYTCYEGVGHDSWVYAYNETLLNWLLSKSK